MRVVSVSIAVGVLGQRWARPRLNHTRAVSVRAHASTLACLPLLKRAVVPHAPRHSVAAAVTMASLTVGAGAPTLLGMLEAGAVVPVERLPGACFHHLQSIPRPCELCSPRDAPMTVPRHVAVRRHECFGHALVLPPPSSTVQREVSSHRERWCSRPRFEAGRTALTVGAGGGGGRGTGRQRPLKALHVQRGHRSQSPANTGQPVRSRLPRSKHPAPGPGACRGPQSSQSVPVAHKLYSEPNPPSSHQPSLRSMAPPGRQSSDGPSMHAFEHATRGPQSSQSVPYAQKVYSEPTPAPHPHTRTCTRLSQREQPWWVARGRRAGAAAAACGVPPSSHQPSFRSMAPPGRQSIDGPSTQVFEHSPVDRLS